MAAQTSDRQYYMFGLKIAGSFGVMIAAPLVVFVLIGRELDERLNQGWLFTVLAFALAAAVSGAAVYRRAKRYGEEYQKLGEKK